MYIHRMLVSIHNLEPHNFSMQVKFTVIWT